ncbi:MAG TPA: hypothetical protein VI321_02925 [Burkholderiales bacterium]
MALTAPVLAFGLLTAAWKHSLAVLMLTAAWFALVWIGYGFLRALLVRGNPGPMEDGR